MTFALLRRLKRKEILVSCALSSWDLPIGLDLTKIEGVCVASAGYELQYRRLTKPHPWFYLILILKNRLEKKQL